MGSVTFTYDAEARKSGLPIVVWLLTQNYEYGKNVIKSNKLGDIATWPNSKIKDMIEHYAVNLEFLPELYYDNDPKYEALQSLGVIVETVNLKFPKSKLGDIIETAYKQIIDIEIKLNECFVQQKLDESDPKVKALDSEFNKIVHGVHSKILEELVDIKAS
jgi:glutathionyl-hydroquinone reductase